MNTTKPYRIQNRLLLAAMILIGVVGPVSAQDPPSPHPHDQVGCKRCHFRPGGPIEQKPTQGLMATAPAAQRESGPAAACAGCHGRAGSGLAADLGFHRSNQRNCSRCHSFHDTATTVGPAAGIDLAAVRDIDGRHCASCHQPGADLQALSDGHRQAAGLYHTDTKALVGLSLSEGCLLCHSRTDGNHWQARSQAGSMSIAEHASHPVGVRVRPGTGAAARFIRTEIDPRTPLFDEKIECQSCHLLTAGAKDLLIPFPQKYDLCLSCHQTGGPQTRPEGGSFQAAMASSRPGRE